MGDGLNVGLNEFKKMSRAGKDAVIFENLVHIRGKSTQNSIHRRFQYLWLLGLTGLMGAKKIFGL